jgi:YD repeat-containing protein
MVIHAQSTYFPYANDPGKDVTLQQIVPRFSLNLGSSVIYKGQTVTGTVSLDKALTFAWPVNLSANPAALSLPQTVYIPAGQSSVTFQYTAGGVTQRTPITVNLGTGGCGMSASAQVEIEPASDPRLGPCDCDHAVGQPINVFNGNTWIEQQDYTLPGLAGGLGIHRTWNSLWSSSSPVIQAGMFGDSWRSNYEEQLQIINLNSLKYWRGDGSAWMFSYVNDNWKLITPPDERATLTFDTGTTLFTLTLKDGTRKIFNNPGYLTQIIDRNNNTTTLTYDASNRLMQVTDAAGRSLTFNYLTSTSKQVLTVQDSVGVIATYAYDGNSRLTRVSYPDTFIGYNYDGNSLLTSVVDANSKVLEAHTYDTSRRGLTSQRANGVDLVTVSYPGPGTAHVVDSKSNASDYNYSFVAGYAYLTSATGTGCASCGAPNQNSALAYDGSGNQAVRIDAAGNISTATYDAAGNVTSKSAGARQPH